MGFFGVFGGPQGVWGTPRGAYPRIQGGSLREGGTQPGSYNFGGPQLPGWPLVLDPWEGSGNSPAYKEELSA